MGFAHRQIHGNRFRMRQARGVLHGAIDAQRAGLALRLGGGWVSGRDRLSASHSSVSVGPPRLLRRPQCAGYDSGMTAAKIAITLPREQLAKVRRAVRSGEASSVSGYIAGALAEKE